VFSGQRGDGHAPTIELLPVIQRVKGHNGANTISYRCNGMSGAQGLSASLA
jgi:hypothetical protein